MSKKQSTPEATPQGSNSATMHFIKYMEEQYPSTKLLAVILGHLLTTPKTRPMMVDYLDRWTKACLSSAGVKDITSSGFDYALPWLIEFSRKDDAPFDWADIPQHNEACDTIENEVLRYVSPDDVLRLKEELAARFGLAHV